MFVGLWLSLWLRQLWTIFRLSSSLKVRTHRSSNGSQSQGKRQDSDDDRRKTGHKPRSHRDSHKLVNSYKRSDINF